MPEATTVNIVHSLMLKNETTGDNLLPLRQICQPDCTVTVSKSRSQNCCTICQVILTDLEQYLNTQDNTTVYSVTICKCSVAAVEKMYL